MNYLEIIELAKKNIGNSFDLIVIASKRARDIQKKYSKSLLDSDECIKDKPTLIALKEISKGLITQDYFYVNNTVIKKKSM